MLLLDMQQLAPLRQQVTFELPLLLLSLLLLLFDELLPLVLVGGPLLGGGPELGGPELPPQHAQGKVVVTSGIFSPLRNQNRYGRCRH